MHSEKILGMSVNYKIRMYYLKIYCYIYYIFYVSIDSFNILLKNTLFKIKEIVKKWCFLKD